MDPSPIESPTMKSLQSYSKEQLNELFRRMTPEERKQAFELIEWDLCSRATASFEQGPLLWLTAYTKTENPKYVEQGCEFRENFPRWSYFVPVMDLMLNCLRLFIPKTREMMTSWEVMGYAGWRLGWHPGSQVIVQADKEDKAWGLANYVRILYRNSEEWIRRKWGKLIRGEEGGGHLKWSNGSELIAVPSGESQIRYYHPTVFIMDEAAKLPEAEQCYGAANPVAQQIIAISSASPSWFGNECELPAT